MNSRRLLAMSMPVAFGGWHLATNVASMEGSSYTKDGKHFHHQPSFGTNNTKRHYQFKGTVNPGGKSLSNLSLISGSAHEALADGVAREMKVGLCKASLQRFADGEVSVQIVDNIRGQDVFIVQPCAAPVNDSIVELLLTVSCAKRSGARRVIAVIPYFGYKHHRRGNAISTKHNSRFLWSGAGDFAFMLQELGVDHIIAVDLQRPGQGSEACFFDNEVPIETIVTTDLFIDNLVGKQKLTGPLTVVAPNAECFKKAKKFQQELQKKLKVSVKLLPFFSMDTSAGPTDVAELVVLDDSMSQVKGTNVVIVDDMIDTGNTLQSLSTRLQNAGAKQIFVCAAHGLFSEKAASLIDSSPVTKILVTDSLPLPANARNHKKIEQVSLAKYLADVIVTEHLQSYHPNEKEVEEKYDDQDDT